MLQEVQAMGTPEQERERLLKQVKEDNIEIASAERQSVDIYQFYYPRDVVSAVYAMATWLVVTASIVSKRLNLS